MLVSYIVVALSKTNVLLSLIQDFLINTPVLVSYIVVVQRKIGI